MITTNMHRILMAISLVVSFFLVCCASEPNEESTPDHEQITLTNASYGPHERQRMDVFLPADRSEATPIVVMIHGGAWITGSKTDFGEMPQLFLEEGIGSINIEYRYASDQHHFEGLMADVALALATVREKAPAWGIRKNQYILLGGSAGGHMALLYAYHYRQDNEVSSVMSFAGPTDISAELLAGLPDNGLKQAVATMVGAPPVPPLSDRYRLASPVTYADTAVPTLLLHGTEDDVVPISQSALLETALQHNGKNVKFHVMEGVSHDFNNRPDAALEAISEFLSWIKQSE